MGELLRFARHRIHFRRAGAKDEALLLSIGEISLWAVGSRKWKIRRLFCFKSAAPKTESVLFTAKDVHDRIKLSLSLDQPQLDCSLDIYDCVRDHECML